MMRATALAVTAALLCLAGGCAGSAPAPTPAGSLPGAATVESPFDACPSAGSSAGSSAPPEGTVAAITLPCFAGGAAVTLGRIGRPAVVNLWASWCGPCRTELPQLQRLADAAGDDLVVLGVVSGDAWTNAAELGQDLAITFPAVFDPSFEVQRAVGQRALPMTLFVDAAGQVRHVHATSVLTWESAVDLVRTYLGLDVA